MGILVVDDLKESRELVRLLLQRAGYRDVAGEQSAEDAFHVLGMGRNATREGSERFDLILLDLFMPTIGGVELCRRIKEDPYLKEIPVIMITASESDEVLQSAFAAGASDYIKKPINRTELLARVGSLVELKSERDRRKAREKELLGALEQVRNANEVLRRLSSIDGLTGIANRRNFDEYIDREWKRAVRDQRPISAIMVDIDHFKKYNDGYGHQKGDECLKKVAQVLAESVKRPADIVARYGGEEFIVILPDTDRDGALELANYLRREMEEVALPHDFSPVAPVVTFSLGVATALPEREDKVQQFIEKADRALYEAKNGGRNQVCLAP